jgi:hypothetical protein
MQDVCIVGSTRMKDYDISFRVPFSKPKLGDRVACWAMTAQSISQRGYVTRQGHVKGTVLGADDAVVAYAVKDEVSGETVYVAPDMVFVPGDEQA